MANNSIKGRFRTLYQEVEDNLTEKSKTNLKELSKINVKELYNFQNNLIALLNDEYQKILNSFGTEYGISVNDIECRMFHPYIWDNYCIAIEKLNESIRKYRTEEELNREFEELLSPIRDQSEEETAYWDALRAAINGYDDYLDDEYEDEDDFEDYEDDSPEEKSKKAIAYKIEDSLPDRLSVAVREIEDKLNITGQVIYFFIDMYSSWLAS